MEWIEGQSKALELKEDDDDDDDDNDCYSWGTTIFDCIEWTADPTPPTYSTASYVTSSA